MRSTYPCLYILTSLLACGPGGNSTTDTGNETTQSTATTATTTGGSTTAEPTTSPTVATTGTATTADPSDPDTSLSTSDPATTDTTSTSTTSTTSTTGTTGSDTGSAVGECQADADCQLQDDCCVCDGIPNDQNPVLCDLECKQSKCSELGIDKAVCRLGVCETERLSCDQTKVVCDALPPVCPKGQLPTTSPACWTGKCVPAEFCDVVLDCSLCPDGHLCVQNIDLAPNQPTCEPIPPGCGPDPDCACAGDLVCNDPFSLCVEQAGPVINCECINC